MKKTVRILLLTVLCITETWLLTAFLPVELQTVISGWIGTVLPHSYDYSRVTHPALGHEIDQALSQLPALKVALYSLFALLLTVNTCAIVRVVKNWRSGSSVTSC